MLLCPGGGLNGALKVLGFRNRWGWVTFPQAGKEAAQLICCAGNNIQPHELLLLLPHKAFSIGAIESLLLLLKLITVLP